MACGKMMLSGVLRDSRGFTLIEVIIAAVILFAALVIGAVAHRASVRVIDKSAAVIAASDALPSIVENIKADLSNHENKGSGHYGPNITYEWSAVETKSSPDILSEFSETTGGMEYGRFDVAMKTVTVKLTRTSNGKEHVFPYEYQELACFQNTQAVQLNRPLPQMMNGASP